MCKVLKISRSLVYYKPKNQRKDKKLENHIIRIFKESKNNYGSRKIFDICKCKTYKIIKTEFAFNRIFESFEELETELFDYVNWYNNIRIHSSLNYLTPIEYKKGSL